MGGKQIKNHPKISVSTHTKNHISASTPNKFQGIKRNDNKSLTSLAPKSINKSFNEIDKSTSKSNKILSQELDFIEDDVIKPTHNETKSEEILNLLKNTFINHFFLKNIDFRIVKEIINEMPEYFVDKDEVVVKQGTLGNYFYIIKEGTVSLNRNDKMIKKLSVGDSFGELALLHETERSATIVALEKTYFYIIGRKKFKEILLKQSESNYEENKRFLNSFALFDLIENDQKEKLIQSLIKESYNANDYIFREGDEGYCLYLIKEGEILFKNGDRNIRTLKKGNYFGEKSILLDSKRTMDVISKSDSIVYSISRELIKEMVGEKYKEILLLNFIKQSFLKSKYLKLVESKHIESIFEFFKIQNFPRSSTVVKKGVNITKLNIVIEGSIISNTSKKLICDRGEILFEKELISTDNEFAKEQLIAEPDCLIAECDMEIILKVLGGSIKKIVEKSILLESLKNVPIFINLIESQLFSIIDTLTIETYSNSKIIVKQGETSSNFYIIKSGKVDVLVNGTYVRTLSTNEYFGERALFFNEFRTATVQANGNVELIVISKSNFLKIVDQKLKDHLAKKLLLQDDSVELKDLIWIKDLGQGTYGNVSLVICSKNKSYYAIKTISRAKIDYDEIHELLLTEKSILLQIDHIFIVKLVKTLGDAKNVYFLMEYIRGPELFSVTKEIGLLPKSSAQFYFCSILLTINYLHQRQFIHRDIKPENIIINEDGQIKLIDFGTSKKLTDRTSTVIGTPHYMAPEVIMGKGYSFQIDLWSLGICLFEFVCGFAPFGENTSDSLSVYSSVLNEDLKIPSNIADKDLISILKNMLVKDPSKRLSKIQGIKEHPWVADFDWNELCLLNLKPPFIPKLKELNPSKENTTFIEKMKYLKAFVPPKEKIVDKKKKELFENWHKSF